MSKRLVKMFISIIFLAGYTCYQAVCHALRKKISPVLIVLNYHSINRNQRKRFARQMNILKRYHLVFSDTDIQMNSLRHFVAITFDDGFVSVVENALPELINYNIPATIFIPTGYMGQRPGWPTFQNTDLTNESVMGPEQLQSLPKDCIRIGSHSISHRFLTLLDKDDAMHELVGSKSYLENLLNRRISTLSLPYGAYDSTVLELASSSGYRRVFGSWPMYPLSRPENFFVGRIPVGPDDWALEFRLKIMGAYQWLPIGILLKRKVYKALKISYFAGYPSKQKTIW